MITVLRVQVSDNETLEVSWTSKRPVPPDEVAAMARALLVQSRQPKVTHTAGFAMTVDPDPYVRLLGRP